MNERGFIALPLIAWGAIAAGVVILGLGIAVKVQSSRLDACKAEFGAFRTQVEVLGREAEKVARAKELSDLKAKEKTNAEFKRLSEYNIDLNKRLRDSRARSNFLPPAAPTARSPGIACFERTDLESALQRLDVGVSGLIEEGITFQLRLSTAAEWAASIATP